MTTSLDTDRLATPDFHLGLSWLLRLRWVAVVGQLSAIAVVKIALDADIPYAALLALVAATAVSNVALSFFPKAETGRSLAVVLVGDVCALTAMLALSGGAANPFTVFFLVHVALAALLLPLPLVWALVALTVGAFGLLFLVPSDGPMAHHHHGGGAGSFHLVGMWIAYGVAAAFVAHFVGKVSRAVRERDQRLSEIERHNERLATLSSFAANAAHELGSPLATIGLATKELAIGLRDGRGVDVLLPDADLASREVGRCRDILEGLSARAGESMGEMPTTTTIERILDDVARSASPRHRPRLHVELENEDVRICELIAPARTIGQLLLNLVRNAFDAHDEAAIDEPVTITVSVGERVSFHVLDRGAGLSARVREQLGEPFVTTKASQGGLGLGVYLARAYAERTGGHLSFHDRPGGGTDVELVVARDAIGASG